jgi:tRNA threonylcarbamoyl adenosine modification protein (Sua5/YciO/YrdC/YwlC family)
MGEHLYTYTNPVNEKDLERCRKVLEDGGVLAYPTDFNYAFGCDASNGAALEKIHRLKPTHPQERPFSLLCSSIAMASEVAVIDNWAFRALKKAWPGPYTVLLPASRSLPKLIHDKRKVVGVRVPSNELLLKLIESFGKPLATSSVPDVKVNDVDGLQIVRPPQFGYQVHEFFGHGVDIVLDLGDEVSGEESTILDMSEGTVEVVRIGVGSTDPFE